MKYLLYLMCFLVIFSLPLAYLGLYITPSFSTSLASFADYVDRTDTFAFRVLELFSNGLDIGSKSAKGDYYVFDDNNPNDNILMTASEQFYDATYCVVVPKKIRDSHPLFAEIGSNLYYDPSGGLDFFNGYDYRKMTFVIVFDRFGNFLRYFGFYDGQITLAYSDYFQNSYYMPAVGKMVLDLPKDKFNPLDFTNKDPVISAKDKGCFIDLVNKYQGGFKDKGGFD